MVAQSEMEKQFLRDSLVQDPWKVICISVIRVVVAGLKEGLLTPPVEGQITSATDEPLLHLRLTSPEHGALEILQSDESRCQSSEIFPVTTTIADGAGRMESWEEVDPRPKRIN
jgi:hypothetical protein